MTLNENDLRICVLSGIHYTVYISTLAFRLLLQGEELKEAVKSEFFPWLSQYLVMKRVSIEPNFHDLYIKFMETLKWKELFQLVLQETYRNIKVQLKLDNI